MLACFYIGATAAAATEGGIKDSVIQLLGS